LVGNIGTGIWTVGALLLSVSGLANVSWVHLVRQFLGLFKFEREFQPESASAEKPMAKARVKEITSRVPIVPEKNNPDPVPEEFEPIVFEAEPVQEPNYPVSSPAKIKAPRLVVEADPEDYEYPPLELLEPGGVSQINSKENTRRRNEQAKMLEQTLASFGVEAKVVNITPGPSVTRFELQPGVGVKIAKITALAKDIALKLAAPDVRMEAPIPGKAAVGIEVPNAQTDTVTLRGLLEKTDFYSRTSKLSCGIGLTITGEPTLMDLAKMPHVLIAGATGSGKSVCVNVLILSILLRARPDEVKFLMIDPKKVELSLYDGIPHLVAPVVTDPHKAAATLNKWALVEMERRYETFSKVGVKNIEGYNQWVGD
ncbi:DNA translocase FtsK, partial [bacterium]|nr:DNA translocase FtsK [bacterium]